MRIRLFFTLLARVSCATSADSPEADADSLHARLGAARNELLDVLA